MGVIAIGTVFNFLLWIGFNKFKAFNSARIGFILSSHVMFICIQFLMPISLSISNVYLLLGCMPLLLFPANHRKLILSFVLLSLSCFWVLEILIATQTGPWGVWQIVIASPTFATVMPLVLNVVITTIFFGIILMLFFDQAKRMEQLAQSKLAADKANIAKSEFLSTMSHEIRTPLNAVIGMTSLLADTSLDEDQAEFVRTAKMGGENLLSVINDILDYSKIESGKLELEEQPFPIKEAIDDVLDLLSIRAREKGLELLHNSCEALPHEIIHGDITRLRQVLVNLVGNAIKFTEKGEIIVSTNQTLLPSGRLEVTFSVKDSGIGIPAERRDRLFNAFMQVDASTTRKYGGTGLGLVICQRLVHLMGGEIWLESQPGEGTTFYFTLNVQAALHQEQQASLAEMTLPFEKQKVLVVDDNPVNLKIISCHLEKWNLRPSIIMDPALAAEMCQHQNFALAILDMHMPGIDGCTLARQLKAMRPDLPLIMLSSTSVPPVPEDKNLFFRWMTKPARQQHIFRAIYQILNPTPEEDGLVIQPEPTTTIGVLNEERKPRILLAEDNAINQKVAIRMLEKLGYHADLAANGLEALKITHLIDYDIIFMDMQMPEMDGLTATTHILANCRKKGKRPPVIIAMTANAMERDQQRCFEAGMKDYLAKPVRPPQLAEIIQKWCKILREELYPTHG